MKHAVLSLLLLGGSFAAPADAPDEEEPKIYACPDASGDVIYQNDPCDEATPPKPSAPPARVAPPAVAPRPAAPRVQTPPAPAAPRSQPRPVRRGGGGRFPTRLEGSAASRPSFASPEATWQTFLGAIESQDPSAAADCFTSEARATFGPAASMFPLEQVQRTLDTFQRIEDEGDLGPFWSIRALRPKRPPKWILFERTGTGEWKLVGL